MRLFDDLVNDPDGSPKMATRLLGMSSTEDIAVAMILCTLSMLCILGGTLTASSYVLWLRKYLENKWSTCALEPPRVRSWKRQGIYACFITHYKMGEALHSSRHTLSNASFACAYPFPRLCALFTLRGIALQRLPQMRVTCTTC